MSPGELQRIGQRTAEAEAADGADHGADEPATPQARRRQVPDGEQHDRGGQSGVEQRLQEWAVGNHSFHDRGRREHLQPGQHQDHRQQAPELPERGDQTKKEREAIEPERVDGAKFDETPRHLVPAWIERDPARVTRQLVAEGTAVDGQELEPQLQPLPQFGRYVDADRKMAAGRPDRILEQDVEEALVPEKIGVYRQRRTLEVSEGGCVV